jgi:dihydrofolate reductase
MVFPVFVGGGKRFFPESLQKKSFRLADSTTFPSGVVVSTYEPSTT